MYQFHPEGHRICGHDTHPIYYKYTARSIHGTFLGKSDPQTYGNRGAQGCNAEHFNGLKQHVTGICYRAKPLRC